MSKIFPDDVKKVAKLARLEISEDQVEIYTSQLEQILGYVEQLQCVDTADVEPTTRAVEVVNNLREDKVVSSTVREQLLEQAPEREENFFRVPKILVD